MKSLIFATGNPHKVREIATMLEGQYQITPMADIGCTEDIPETADTFEGNALIKARYISTNYKMDCFAEDSGLEVDALHGAPGVYTARYAGLPKDDQKNMELLLRNMSDTMPRSARFQTVIALIIKGKEYLFNGTVEGRIAYQMEGTGGFGYDPIFIPEGYDRSFAQLDPSVKKEISHRAKAVQKLVAFLTGQTDR